MGGPWGSCEAAAKGGAEGCCAAEELNWRWRHIANNKVKERKRGAASGLGTGEALERGLGPSTQGSSNSHTFSFFCDASRFFFRLGEAKVSLRMMENFLSSPTLRPWAKNAFVRLVKF